MQIKKHFLKNKKEIEGICNPIVSKVYQQHGGSGASSGSDDEDLPNHDDL